MKINIGAVVEIKEERKTSTFNAKIINIYQANDAPADSTDLNDYIFIIKNIKTGKIENASGPKILRVIKEGVTITDLKYGDILKVLIKNKQYIATFLGIEFNKARVKINRTDNIEHIEQYDILDLI